MSIFELTGRICEADRKCVLDAAARCTLMHGKQSFRKKHHLLLPFWNERLFERGIVINIETLERCAPVSDVYKYIRSMEWNGSKKWDRDFFEGFFDACARVESSCQHRRAEVVRVPRISDFMLGDDHGQKIRFIKTSAKASFKRTGPLHFLEIPMSGNLEKYLCGVLSGGRPVYRNGELWVSVRGKTKSVLNRLGVSYSGSNRNSILLSPFYSMLFMDDMPPGISEFWKNEIGTRTHRNGIVTAWMHWDLIYGRKKRRFLNSFPHLKSPQGCNRAGVYLNEVRERMKNQRFDHVDARIRSKLEHWLTEKEKER